MFAIAAPGQGSQTPGMLAGWLRDPAHAERLRAWSEAADCDLLHLGTKATARQIARTENTQPLLVAQGLLAHDELSEALPTGRALVAGHSVGELTAAAFAGVLSAADAVRLAAVRGRAMAAACAEAPTSMAAVIGGDRQQVLDRLGELGLTAATFNGTGQIVAAGLTEDIEALSAAPPPSAVVRQLPVAGAFHTPYMETARRAVAAAAAATPFAYPRQLLLSNADGQVVSSPEEIRRRLIGQLVQPVRWDLCLETIARDSPALVLCLPPARTLADIFRRQLPEVGVLSVDTARELALARTRLAAVTGERSARAGI